MTEEHTNTRNEDAQKPVEAQEGAVKPETEATTQEQKAPATEAPATEQKAPAAQKPAAPAKAKKATRPKKATKATSAAAAAAKRAQQQQQDKATGGKKSGRKKSLKDLGLAPEPEDKLIVLAAFRKPEANPKRNGTDAHKRFAMFQQFHGKKWGELVKAWNEAAAKGAKGLKGFTPGGELAWCAERGYVELQKASAAPKKKGAAKKVTESTEASPA